VSDARKKKPDYARVALNLMAIAKNGRNQKGVRYINVPNDTMFNSADYVLSFRVIGCLKRLRGIRTSLKT
jgi:hypothetical protein